MPALPNVPKVLKLAVQQTLNESIPILNRAYFQYSGSDPTSGDLSAFLSTAASAWVTRLFANLSSQLVLNSITGTVLTSDTSPEVVMPASGSGASDTASTPAGTALVLQFPIARRYRGGKPRMYLAGIPDDQLVDRNTWTTVVADALASDWDAWTEDLAAAIWSGGGTLVHVNVSYFEGFTNHTYPSGRVKPIPNLRVTPIVDVCGGAAPNMRVASQRRRNQQGL